MSLTPAWETAIADWLTSLRAAGRPTTTIRTRRQQLQQLAKALHELDPWAVPADDLVVYLGAQTWAAETRHAHRSAIRTFYAWGLHRKHITVDPARDLPAVRRTLLRTVWYDVAERYANHPDDTDGHQTEVVER